MNMTKPSVLELYHEKIQHVHKLFTGLVPLAPEIVELADGETIVSSTFPIFGIDIKCGSNTDISYGPWADRQR